MELKRCKLKLNIKNCLINEQIKKTQEKLEDKNMKHNKNKTKSHMGPNDWPGTGT